MAKQKLAAEVADITPEMAAEWLEKNLEHQRLIARGSVEVYKQDMLAGRWKITGESIVFDDKGNLVNGQHRLRAAVEAKYTIKDQVIVRGVDADAFQFMDTGRRRNAADVLTIAGFGGDKGEQRYVKTLGAAAAFAFLYKMHLPPVRMGRTTRAEPGRTAPNRYAVTHNDVLTFVADNPTLRNSNKLIMQQQGFKKLLIPSSILVWTHFQCRKIEAELADGLVQAIVTGENLKKGDPFLTLRELLIVERESERRVQRVAQLAGIVKCWNAKRDKETISRPGSVFKKDWEEFPRFH